jgi:hypothetical protein
MYTEILTVFQLFFYQSEKKVDGKYSMCTISSMTYIFNFG